MAAFSAGGSAPHLPIENDPPAFTNFGDVNGDGKADLIFRTYDNRILVSLSTGSGFGEPTHWLSITRPFLPRAAQFADFNADGMIDLMFQDSSNSFSLALSNGSTFEVTKNVIQIPGNTNYVFGQAQYAPISKTASSPVALPTLIFQASDGAGSNNFNWYEPILNGPKTLSFKAPTAPAVKQGDVDFAAGRSQYADLNGDGAADLIYQGNSGNFAISLGNINGAGFSTVNQDWLPSSAWSSAFESEFAEMQKNTATYICPGTPYSPRKCGLNFNFGQVQYSDVDGDGLADLLYQSCNNWIYAARSTGTSFRPPEVWAVTCGVFQTGFTMYADVVGNGSSSLINLELKKIRVSTSTCHHKPTDANKDCQVSPSSTGYTSAANSQVLNYPAGFTRSDIQPGRAWHADVNGDGKHDLAIQTTDGQIYVALSNFCPVDATCSTTCPDNVSSSNLCNFVQWTQNTYINAWSALPNPRTGDEHVSLVGMYSSQFHAHLDNNMFSAANAANVTFIWDDMADAESFARVLPRRIAANALMGLKSIVEVQRVFFGDDTIGVATAGCRMNECHWPLRSNYQARWDTLVPIIQPLLRNIGAFYIYDEPLYWLEEYVDDPSHASYSKYPNHPWFPHLVASGMEGRLKAYSYLQTAAAAVKQSFPTIPTMVVENQPKAKTIANNASDPSFPAAFDLVGFDCYSSDFDGCEGPSIIAGLKKKFAPNQKLVLVPPATYGANTSGDNNFCQPLASNQSTLIQRANSWFTFARSEPLVAAVLPWTAHNDLSLPLANGTCPANIWGAMENKWGSLDNTSTKKEFLKSLNSLLNN